MARSCLPLTTIRCKQLSGNVKTPLSPSAVTPNLTPSDAKSNSLFNHSNARDAPGSSSGIPRYTLASMPTQTAKSLSRIAVALFALTIGAPSLRAQSPTSNVKPDWCRQLPRPQYTNLDRVSSPDPWFEVYKVTPGVFAIYEPHQFEETISFLILGEKRALLFDTGMGISNIRKVTEELTKLPVDVLNSHTHNDHV